MNVPQDDRVFPECGNSEIHSSKPGDGNTGKRSSTNLQTENLTEGVNSRDLHAEVVTMGPRASSAETEIFIGEKWFYVLEGKLEMLVNSTSYILSEGDSIYLESTAAHRWRNAHEGETKALVLSSPCSLSV